MGKAKVVKKPTTPVKISTSLFHQRKVKHSSSTSESSTDSSSEPSPHPLTKKKVMKKNLTPVKTKPKVTPGAKSTIAKSKSTPQKKEKGEGRKKVIGTKGKEKSKEESKGVKVTPGKTKSKEKVKSKKEKSPSPKTKRKNVRQRSQSSNSDTDSTSSCTDDTSSSHTRSPSPPRKTTGIVKKTNNSPGPKSKPVQKKVPVRKDKDGEKKISKNTKEGAKGPSKKPKLTIPKKGTPLKPKGKLTKPKAKLKRMASLNAKAILEASFSFEATEKKRSPAVTPVKSTKGLGTNQEALENESIEFKPLTLLFSSVTDTNFPKDTGNSPKGGERKRKSSSTTNLLTKSNESPNSRRESTGSNGNQRSPTPIRRDSEIQVIHGLKIEKEKSKSPGPKKKPKVMSSSVSTSTSPFDPSEDSLAAQQTFDHHHTIQHHGSSDDMDNQRHFTLPAFHHHNLHSDDTSSHFHQTQKVRRGSQGKEKVKSATPTPVPQFGSTVYQPAGPLIEPHKTGSIGTVPVGLLPDTVRIPSDLKVTYQTRPPTYAVLTVSSTGNQGSKGNEIGNKKSDGRHSGSKITPTSNSQRSQTNKHILHQPYKSTTTAPTSMTVATSTKQSQQSSAFPLHSPLAVASTFSGQGSGGLMMSSSVGSPLSGGTGTLTQSSALPSHMHPSSSTILATGTSASPGSLYFGYGGPPHQSPFSPSKYPMVPPDSYRAHSPFPSPYLYAPTAPQPPPNYFMTPSFYSSPNLGQGGGSSGLTVGQPQARPLFTAHHHPSTGGITGAPFYQPPPSAHPVSNYYVTAPPIQQPSHHSMQPSTAPGHAGLSPPNPSSQPACPCPMESSQRNSNSISNNNNSINITINNNKANRSLLRKLPQQLPVTSATEVMALVDARTKPKPKRIRNTSKLLTPNPNSLTIKQKPNRLNKKNNPGAVDLSRAKQLENAKTFTEQYSLPDDITITPIIMNRNESKALPFSAYGTLLPQTKKPEKKKDIVHVIDTRSGESTTIAKHISSNNIHRQSLTPRNVSSVKPNNAGNVGKISPSLDVIVLSPERKQFLSNLTVNQELQYRLSEKVNHQRSTLLTSGGFNAEHAGRQAFKSHYHGKSLLLTNSNTNLVQPLLQTAPKSENKNKVVRRKGLNECIDGLQRKKMRILADTNVSITNVSTPLGNMNSHAMIGSPPIHHHQLTIIPAVDSHNAILVNNLQDMKNQLLSQKPGRKDREPKQRPMKSLAIEPSRRQSLNKRTTSTESDLGTKLIDCNAAVAAVSALLILPPLPTSLPSPPVQPYSLHNTGMKKRQYEKKKGSLKIKLYKSDEGKITTRSTVQNSKVRTRGPKVKTGEGSKGILKYPSRGRPRLLIRDKDESKSDSSGSLTPNFHHPDYQGRLTSLGNGSSTLTTSNNHVILRIPKSSNDKSKVDKTDISTKVTSYPVSSGNMTLHAIKKRAIVKPLSPSVINGALSSLAMSNKKLPIHTNQRWSNGWRFEGNAFEAKVYIKNDDNPVLRRCYPAMRHDGGDVIQARDCVLLKSGPRKTDLPFVAKVAALFENPADGEMMFSLLWYYRPEHTDIGRNKEDMPDEIFASKHRDSNSVATIEDKCYVFTFNEYCRYKKRLKQLLEGITETTPIVPLSTNQADTRVPVTNFSSEIANAVWFGISTTLFSLSSSSTDPASCKPPPEPTRLSQSTGKVSPEVVFFCRKVYDYRQKRMLKNPS